MEEVLKSHFQPSQASSVTDQAGKLEDRALVEACSMDKHETSGASEVNPDANVAGNEAVETGPTETITATAASTEAIEQDEEPAGTVQERLSQLGLNDDPAQLKEHVFRLQEERDEMEEQYTSLMTKVSQMRTTLGERLRQDSVRVLALLLTFLIAAALDQLSKCALRRLKRRARFSAFRHATEVHLPPVSERRCATGAHPLAA